MLGTSAPAEGFDPNTISARATLTPEQQQRLNAYNMLRSYGGVGQDINLGHESVYQLPTLEAAKVIEPPAPPSAGVFTNTQDLGPNQVSGIGGYTQTPNPNTILPAWTPTPIQYNGQGRDRTPILTGQYDRNGNPLDAQAIWEQQQLYGSFGKGANPGGVAHSITSEGHTRGGDSGGNGGDGSAGGGSATGKGR
jgi:hypothetical protein